MDVSFEGQICDNSNWYELDGECVRTVCLGIMNGKENDDRIVVWVREDCWESHHNANSAVCPVRFLIRPKQSVWWMTLAIACLSLSLSHTQYVWSLEIVFLYHFRRVKGRAKEWVNLAGKNVYSGYQCCYYDRSTRRTRARAQDNHHLLCWTKQRNIKKLRSRRVRSILTLILCCELCHNRDC